MDPYKYICVLDFEATCDGDLINKEQDDIKRKIFHPCHEVIEFPSVLLERNDETGNYAKIAEIQNYCKPLYNIELTDFCKGLTGITQEQVNSGMNFADAYEDHHRWLVANTQCETDKIMILTCGKWDLLTMMPMECLRWNIKPPTLYRRVINLKDAFKTVYYEDDKKKKQRYGMADMLEQTRLGLEGRHHSGIDDCRNIARLVQHLAARGCKFTEALVTKFNEPNMYRVNKKKKKAIMNASMVEKRLTIGTVMNDLVQKMSSNMVDDPVDITDSIQK